MRGEPLFGPAVQAITFIVAIVGAVLALLRLYVQVCTADPEKLPVWLRSFTRRSVVEVDGKLRSPFRFLRGKAGYWYAVLAICAIVVTVVLSARVSAPVGGRERVALLLPACSPIKSVQDDARHQLDGFDDYCFGAKDRPRIDIVVGTHTGDLADAKNVIRDEMTTGTKVFIVTMSSISEPLSQEWPGFVESVGCHDCMLIATVASSPYVSTRSDLVRRFYIRSQEEGQELARSVPIGSVPKSAVTICVDDHYGDGAMSSFAEWWSQELRGVITCTLRVDVQDARRLERQISKIGALSPKDREYAFIANYGEGISKTIECLARLDPKPKLLVTSTFSIREWREAISPSVLSQFEWTTVRPLYEDGGEEFQDVVRDFTHFTIWRTIAAVSDAKKKAIPFHEAWDSLTMPETLKFRILNGDSEIRLVVLKSSDAERPF